MQIFRLTETILFCRQREKSFAQGSRYILIILFLRLPTFSSSLHSSILIFLLTSSLLCSLLSSHPCSPLFYFILFLFSSLICLLSLFPIFWSMPILITPSTLRHYIDVPKSEAPFEKSLPLLFPNIVFLVESGTGSLPNNTLK